MAMILTCEQCNKRLSRKTARLIEGRVLCSTCMFKPPSAIFRDSGSDRNGENGEAG